MLTEIKQVRQEREAAGRRRWFESDGLDLVVWLDACEAVTGFQLCYDLGRGEHALTWRPGAGFAHSAVDAGDATPLANLTPILVPDGAVPWEELADLFERHSGALEQPLRELVRTQLAERSATASGGS